MKKIASGIAILAIIAGCGGRDKNIESSGDLNLGAPVYAICGNSKILGTKEDSFSRGGCGIKNPVKVYAVSGVKLSTPAEINCETATQLNSWVSNQVKPLASSIGRKLVELNVMASYACRPRNNVAGAKLSEHGQGNAIDIGGFEFSDGSTATVLTDYRSSTFGKFLKSARSQACGTFGTVLGPGSDRHHSNHFHFDIASYGNGPYCK